MRYFMKKKKDPNVEKNDFRHSGESQQLKKQQF